MMRRAVLALGTLGLVSAGAAPPPARAQETTIDIVATNLRARGYTCERPSALEPDPDHSRPDERAWLLTCETGRYRVIFKGDTGPEVEKLGG
jgi:hypothetical protein